MTTLVLVALGVGVVAAVVVRYRPAIRKMPMKEWLPFLFPTPERTEHSDQDDGDQVVSPRTVTLREFMNDTGVEGNVYVDAQRLPGYGQLEQLDQVARQWESGAQNASRSHHGEKVAQ